MWPSNYLLKGTKREDVEIDENDMRNAYAHADVYKDVVKYYA